MLGNVKKESDTKTLKINNGKSLKSKSASYMPQECKDSFCN